MSSEELSRKDRTYWKTIDRRHVFREMRWTINKLGLDLYIPGNHVGFTAEYCEKYGDSSIERLKKQP